MLLCQLWSGGGVGVLDPCKTTAKKRGRFLIFLLCEVHRNIHRCKAYLIKVPICEGRQEPAHTTDRLRLILFSKITSAFLFRIFSGFLHVPVPTTQIYCLTGAIISETHIIIKTIHNKTRFSTHLYFPSSLLLR